MSLIRFPGTSPRRFNNRGVVTATAGPATSQMASSRDDEAAMVYKAARNYRSTHREPVQMHLDQVAQPVSPKVTPLTVRQRIERLQAQRVFD
jgi:hypothetical protein